jgi:hypothetical protein
VSRGRRDNISIENGFTRRAQKALDDKKRKETHEAAKRQAREDLDRKLDGMGEGERLRYLRAMQAAVRKQTAPVMPQSKSATAREQAEALFRKPKGPSR